jgi:hypothetical protein
VQKSLAWIFARHSDKIGNRDRQAAGNTWKNIRQNGGAIPLIHRFFLKFSQFKLAQQSIAA